MPTFELEAGGKTYELDAPDQASALSAFQKFSPQSPSVTSQMASAVTDIPSEIGSAAKSALGTITDNLNPFSDARHASYQRQANAPFFSGLGETVNQTLGVGKGLLAIPELVGSPITGTARSAIGHPYSALTGIPYDQAKDAVDTAMMALRPVGATPRGLMTKPAPVPAAADLKAAATAGYDAAKNSGVEFQPSALTRFSSGVKADLNADGLNDVLAPKTFGVLDKIGVAPPGATVTTNDFRTLQRALGYAAKSTDPTERMAAGRAIKALNDHIENLPASDIARGTPLDAANVSATIKEANANYAGYKRSEDFNFRGEKAQNNADAANSGMNLENNLRSQVRQILNNKNLQRGYDADTLAAFKAFNSGSRSANVMRRVGNILGGGGGWSTLINGVIGNAIAGPLGAIAEPAIGAAIKSAGNARSSRQFQALAERIRANTPLARSMPALQAPPPSPLLSPAIPYQFSQGLPVFPGAIPAYAQDNQRNGRR